MSWAGLGGLAPARADQYAAPSGGNMLPAPSPGEILARVVVIFGPSGGLFVYNGTPGPGTLIASITAPGVATDPYGNPVAPEFSVYGSGGQLATLAVSASGEPVLFLNTNRPGVLFPGELFAEINGLGLPNEVQSLTLSGPRLDAPNDDQAYIELQSAPANGSGSAGGNLRYLGNAATGNSLTSALQWGSGGIFAQLFADGNLYDILEKKFFAGGGQTFTSLSGVPFSWLTGINVAALIYFIDMVLYCENIVAGVSDLINIFQGTAVVGNVCLFLDYSLVPTTNPPVTASIFRQVVTSVTTFQTPGFGVGTGYRLHVFGTIEFSTAGTWGAVGAVSAAGDSWDLFFGSYCTLRPKLV